MEVSNNDVARILGRIEATLELHTKQLSRQEGTLNSIKEDLSERLDDHDERIRAIEVAHHQTAQLLLNVKEHEERLRILEKSSAKTGMIGGVGAGIFTATIIELLKRKLGL